jgi:2-oxoglutarate dehydrogenase E2 component (dihydrolipoamide succinyltransferase)
MATEIVIPNVGESITSGVISSWSKKDGEFVQRDDTVLELETDKVTMAVPAPASGIVRQRAATGAEVAVGSVVGVIEESAGGAPPAAAPAAAAASAQGSKSAVATASPPAAPPAPAPAAADRHAESNGDSRATPLARKVAQELNVDLSKVHGTGASQRIREQDVVAFARSSTAAAPAKPAPQPAGVSSPATRPAAGRGVTRERMSPLRRSIAARLVEAQHTAAMLTTFNECDMTAVMNLRKRFKEDFEKKHGVGLGFMSFFVKAVVNALRAIPMVNAAIVQGENGQPEVEKHDYCDIAIAVSSPKGLVVPVLRDCQGLTFAQIEAGIKDLGTRARDAKLTLEEMQGGTFTITNGGIFGSLMSTPILNPPQAAILGMHAIKNRAVEDPDKPGTVAIRPMMYLALSYDHRLIDGAEAVKFLVKVKEGIEDPQRLMLEL